MSNSQEPQFTVSSGFYRLANQNDSPARYAPPQMAEYDMTTVCFCGGDYIAVMSGPCRFRVVKAPEGFRRFEGKEFLDKPVSMLPIGG
jgi:hypothetical protein